MKDIPMFTAGGGMASLILREIPTRGEAFILVRAVFTTTAELVNECVGFCRAAGSERIYCGGRADFSAYPVYARLIERRISRKTLPKTTAIAVPTDDIHWWKLYNERFSAVPAAQSYFATPEGAYFILDGEKRIGLGQLRDDQLAAVATLERGRGADCVSALSTHVASESVTLLVAEQNLPAMRLYDRLGFSLGEEKEVWYCAQ